MRMVTGIIGCILLTLAIIHAFIPHPSAFTFLLLYASGAICAFATLYSNMHLVLARVFAVGTTAVMFFCFAVFFKMESADLSTKLRSHLVCQIPHSSEDFLLLQSQFLHC